METIVNEIFAAEKLEAVQGRCRSRLTSLEGWKCDLARAVETMQAAGLPVSLQAGAVVTCGSYDGVSKAYYRKSYSGPEGTRATFRRTTNGKWRFLQCWRGEYRDGDTIRYTDAQRAEIEKRAYNRACKF